jgi:tryptophan halogenase
VTRWPCAYHLDAGKFADFLRRHCCETLGVRHVLADVEEVLLAENGDIRAVRTAQAGEVTGDLFVDCGFRRCCWARRWGYRSSR